MEPTTYQSTSSFNPEAKDQQLWEMAKKRAGFKASLASYFFVNCLLVAVWFFSSGYNSYFWPIWPMLGWGLGLAFQYYGAYHSTRLFSAEQEYEKLKEEYGNRQ
jgi:hypothetical protein